MAQQLGAIRFKGKVANVVGFKNSASLKTNNNFVRERATVISNPKTYAQARQRAKVIPAQNFYAAFENVLNHAFLPTDRASRNRNRFISKAMKLDEIPDVLKGSSLLPLCGYQVSEGALGLDSMTEVSTDATAFLNFNINSNSLFDASSTIAEISSEFLKENASLEEGMELTFLLVLDASNDGSGSERMAKVISFVLNKSDSLTTLGDIAPNVNFESNDSGKLAITSNLNNILSGAVIISARTSSSWRYTNSYMGLTGNGQTVVNNTTEAEVVESYMNAATNRTSDLILQQADNQQTEGVHPSSVTTMNITLATGVTGTLSANAANIAVKSTGDRVLVVLDGALTTGAAGSRVAITITPTGGTARPLTPADTTFAGNDSITVAELEAAGL